MLIAPGRTASKAAVAIIDPHVSWYNDIRFYQVRVYTPEYNAAGVCLWASRCRPSATAASARSP
jgi:acyl-homoserine lactone acylase PvdQ